ncbi:MAG TPA: hypothetical protein VFQ07_04185 [Candidatus Polarisedimenticolia bacterium]|nr:hypothetical protein [Candidatus Polarisedimenticolia bacterium]
MACAALLIALVSAGASRAAGQADGKPSTDSNGAPAEPAPSESDKAAEDMARMRADLLARHQGADEVRLTQLMGPPTEKGAKDAELTLVWRGPAGTDPLSCRISATLVGGALANIELSGQPAWDRKTCRKFLRPLLQALPWKSVERAPSGGGASAGRALANDTIVQMVRDGQPTQSILGRIRTQPCKFVVSPEAATVLRRSNVPEVLIQAMAERSCS